MPSSTSPLHPSCPNLCAQPFNILPPWLIQDKEAIHCWVPNLHHALTTLSFEHIVLRKLHHIYWVSVLIILKDFDSYMSTFFLEYIRKTTRRHVKTKDMWNHLCLLPTKQQIPTHLSVCEKEEETTSRMKNVQPPSQVQTHNFKPRSDFT